MVTTRSKTGSIPAPTAHQEAAPKATSAPAKRPIQYVREPAMTPERLAAIKATAEKVRAYEREEAKKIEAELEANPPSQTLRKIPLHVEALEAQISSNSIEDFEIVGDAQKELEEKNFPQQIENQIALEVSNRPIIKPNQGKNPKNQPESLGTTERVTAFVQLKNGNVAWQMQETDIQDHNEDPLGHAVSIRVAPTLKELLTQRGGGLIWREWQSASGKL